MKTIIYRTLLAFAGLTIAMSPLAHSGLLDKIKDTIKKPGEAIEGLFWSKRPDVKVPLDFINDPLNQNKWVKPVIGYEFQFMNYPGDPSRYLRRESLRLRLQGAKQLPGASVIAGPVVEAEFIRPFKKDSLKKVGEDFISDAPPYVPNKAPHSSKRAKNLKPGDYYTCSTKLAFQIAPGTAILKGLAFLGASARYAVSGDFKLDVYRLPEDQEGRKNRIKVVASSLRSKSIGLNAHARIVPDIDVFGFSPLDNLLENRLKVTLMNWKVYDREKGNLFSVSYIYDLDDPKAANAFDRVMNPSSWVNIDFEFNRGPKQMVSKMWRADLEPTSILAESNDSVKFVDESEMDYIKTSKGFKYDLKILDRNRQENFMEIDYQLRQEAGAPLSYYRIATVDILRDYSFGINLRESETRRSATVIFGLNSDGHLTSFDEITLSFERTDNKLKIGKSFHSHNELPSIFGQLRKMLPDIVSDSKVSELYQMMTPIEEVGTFVAMDMNLKPAALAVLAGTPEERIRQVVNHFLDRVVEKLESKDFEEQRHFGFLELSRSLLAEQKNNSSAIENFFSQTKREKIISSLAFVLNGNSDPNVRIKQWQVFKGLRNDKIFKDLGSGILIRVLEAVAQDKGVSLYELVGFKLRYKADGKSTKFLYYGRYDRPGYTKALLRDRDRVLNRRYNPAHFNEKE